MLSASSAISESTLNCIKHSQHLSNWHNQHTKTNILSIFVATVNSNSEIHHAQQKKSNKKFNQHEIAFTTWIIYFFPFTKPISRKMEKNQQKIPI